MDLRGREWEPNKMILIKFEEPNLDKISTYDKGINTAEDLAIVESDIELAE